VEISGNGGEAPGGARSGPGVTAPATTFEPFTSVAQALAWLDSHIDFETTMPNRRALPTLERMQELSALQGDPQRAIPSVHITGTNGKGSTAAMVTALLMVKGLSVGTYTSPNLSRVNERLARDTEPIGDAAFTEVLWSLATLEPLLSERPTRFELLTAAAFRWFADEAVDVMVVEVGLGGTWDCTNVVDADVAVITNISFDHTEVLGPTLEGIARDKAGIIKPGSIVVVGETDPDLVGVITTVAEQAGALQVWVRGQEFDCTESLVGVGGRLIELRTPGGSYPEMFLALHGAHQGRNAACALAAVEAFFGAPSTEEVVEEAMELVRVPGRLEVLGRRPLLLVDGAHNVAGMMALGQSLTEEFSVSGDTVAIVGMLSGRDPSAMLAPLADAGVRTVVACAPSSPRALPPEVVAEAARALGFEVVVARSTRQAVMLARSLVEEDGMLLAAGSLYVVADVRVLLGEGPVPGTGHEPRG
jgi:dihydrofolate synthase / folylpolyglutamate synthase